MKNVQKIKDYHLKKLNKMLNSVKNERRLTVLFDKIHFVANYLYEYNILFDCPELEDRISSFSSLLQSKKEITNEYDLIFFDSFGLSRRGLADIYLDGFINNLYRVLYLTYEDNYVSTKELRDKYETTISFRYIKRGVSEYNLLYSLFCKSKKIVLYITPCDILPVVVAKETKAIKYLINLTDHAYWFGKSVCDYVIDFRNFGSSVNVFRRKVQESNLLLQPYYPNIKETDFLGYPSSRMNKNNTFFSGGALYKTIDDELSFYSMVDYILNKYPSLYYWYAGSGDTTYMKQLMTKHPNRVFLTNERPDLFQIMENIKFYLGTYPMSGGLMTQFAVAANTPALNIVDDDSKEGILLKNGESVFEFENKDLLLKELDLLLSNDSYFNKRVSNLNNTIVSKELFDNNLKSIIDNQQSMFDISLKEPQIERFLETYYERDSINKRCAVFVDKKFTFFNFLWPYYFAGVFVYFPKIIKRVLHKKEL